MIAYLRTLALAAAVCCGFFASANAQTYPGIFTCSAHQWMSSVAIGGVPVCSQPAAADLSNGTAGSGAVVLQSAPTITGHPTIEGVTSTGATGTGPFVFGTSPTIASPTISSPAISGPVLTGITDIQGALKLSNEQTPAQITVDQNDYNPGTVVCSSTTTLIINSNAARNITGIAGGAQGCELFVVNNGGFSITLKDSSVSSAAANRFGFGGDYIVATKGSIHLKYDGTDSLWRNMSGAGAGVGTGTVTSVSCGTGLSGGTITTSGTCAVSLTNITNSLGADVALNNTGTYFDGPSVAQGVTGTWFVSGGVSLGITAGDAVDVRLWDGTTVIASKFERAGTGTGAISVELSGIISSPAGNIRISVKNITSTTGSISFNSSGNSKDSTISGFRIN